MRFAVLLLVGCTACGSDGGHVGGYADMSSEEDAGAQTDAPPPQISHKEKTCERERAWRSDPIGVVASPRVAVALQPLFDSVTFDLRDRIDKGCNWKLQVSGGGDASSSQWVPMHHGSTSFWSMNAQKQLVVEIVDASSRTVTLAVSEVTTRADHTGDCEELSQVDVRGSIREENDEVRWFTVAGDEVRFGDLIGKPEDRQVSLSFSAVPLE
ncbi:MAG: hypothetical protein H6718_23575 [Polyangiaceae bacterium]|nr:hypothetical protein [Polyangiaceae bacterium]